MDSNKKTVRDASYFQTYGALLHALINWASILENFPYGLGALFLNYMLYRLRMRFGVFETLEFGIQPRL